MAEGTAGSLYRLFAGLLEYPTPALASQARACAQSLSAPGSGPFPAETEAWHHRGRAQAAALVDRFCAFVEGVPLHRMEELYTSTFDMQPVCCPYIGYHLFGESYKRGIFMARLNAGYRESGFSAGNELPDHAAVILRFLALGTGDEFSRALLCEGLVPALDKMALNLGGSGANPYAGVVGALLSALQDPDQQVFPDLSGPLGKE